MGTHNWYIYLIVHMRMLKYQLGKEYSQQASKKIIVLEFYCHAHKARKARVKEGDTGLWG